MIMSESSEWVIVGVMQVLGHFPEKDVFKLVSLPPFLASYVLHGGAWSERILQRSTGANFSVVRLIYYLKYTYSQHVQRVDRILSNVYILTRKLTPT